MAQQHIDKLWEELQQLEQRIVEQEIKIEEAIKNDKSQKVIDWYEKNYARLVEEKKALRQHHSALQTQLAGPAGEFFVAAP